MRKKTTKKKEPIAKKAKHNPYGIGDRALAFFEAAAEVYPEKIDVELDGAVLAVFAQSCAELEALNVEIEREGLLIKGLRGFGINPKAAGRQMVIKTLLASAAQLGLSPAARTKIKATAARKAGRKKSKEEAYLDGDEEV